MDGFVRLGRAGDRQYAIGRREGRRAATVRRRRRPLPQLTTLASTTPRTAYSGGRSSICRRASRSRTASGSSSRTTASCARTVLPAIGACTTTWRHDYLAARVRAWAGGAADRRRLVRHYRVRLHTTTALTPQQVHELGLSEVARIRASMERLDEVGHTGDLRSFFDALRADPRFRRATPRRCSAAMARSARVASALPVLFAIAPKAEFEIRAVEPYRAQSAARRRTARERRRQAARYLLHQHVRPAVTADVPDRGDLS